LATLEKLNVPELLVVVVCDAAPLRTTVTPLTGTPGFAEVSTVPDME